MGSYSVARRKTQDQDHPFFILEHIGWSGKSYEDSSLYRDAVVDPTWLRRNGQFSLQVNQGGIRNRHSPYTRHDLDIFHGEVLRRLPEEYPELLEHFPHFLHFTGWITLHFHEGVLRKAEFKSKG